MYVCVYMFARLVCVCVVCADSERVAYRYVVLKALAGVRDERGDIANVRLIQVLQRQCIPLSIYKGGASLGKPLAVASEKVTVI